MQWFPTVIIASLLEELANKEKSDVSLSDGGGGVPSRLDDRRHVRQTDTELSNKAT